MFAKRHIGFVKQIGGIFFLVTYLFLRSNLPPENTHKKNGGKRLYTLNKKDTGCDHPEHVLPYETSCEPCDVCIRDCQWAHLHKEFTPLNKLNLINDFIPYLPYVNESVWVISPRAPPFLV